MTTVTQEQAAEPTIRVPEAPLVEILRTLKPLIPPELERQHRAVAAQWLNDLHKVVKAWNDEFIALLKRYPGFFDSTDRGEYRRFYESLMKQRSEMLDRDQSVKDRLCRPIEHLKTKFPTDFAWLRERNEAGYKAVHGLVLAAYAREGQIIEMADDFINHVSGGDLPQPAQPPPASISEYEERLIDAHISNRAMVRERIEEYERLSARAVANLKEVARDADLHLVSLGDVDVSNHPGYTPPKTIIDALQTTPQTEHRLLYTILAFGFGVVFIITIVVLAVFIPEPSKFQWRVFLTVMALAAAGTATVMSGILNVKLPLWGQGSIGATGALAVFVVVYLLNPAVLE